MEARPWHCHYDFSVPSSIRYPEIPVSDLLQFAASTNPDKTALNFYGTETTFWQLRQQVLKMAGALSGLGLRKGDRIGLQLPNCPQYIISYYAGLSLGAIIVNINPLYTVSELKEIAGQTNLTVLITFDLALSQIRGLCQEVTIPHVIVTQITDFIDGFPVSSPDDMGLDPGWDHFSILMESSPDTKLPRIEIEPEDPALIQFTGGTTGVPKGAVLTHANIIASVIANTMWGYHILQAKDPVMRNVLAVLPYFHLFGNILCLNWGIYTCSTQIIVPRFDIAEVMNTLGNFKGIGYFPAVPTMINAIINHPKAEDLDIGKKLTLITSAAAPMPRETIYKLKDMGIFYSEGWGMTETTSMGTCLPLMGRKKVGSIGIPAPDTDIRLVDVEDGVTIVPRGTPGEITIKGPTVMKEYWNNPEETANHLKDGWLYTGDIAIQDEDDYLFIVDRKKDMIIAGGFNIFPRDIDEVLYQHPQIDSAVTVGVPDDYRGETVKAFVVLKEGATATADEIIDFCRSKLTAYKVPKLIEFRNALPVSAVGKVLRKILRDEEIAKKSKQ